MTHWLVGVLVPVVLLVLIFRSRTARAAPAAMRVLVPTDNAPTQPTVASSDARWERLLLTAATKLSSRPEGALGSRLHSSPGGYLSLLKYHGRLRDVAVLVVTHREIL